jgi:hypothetical protein
MDRSYKEDIPKAKKELEALKKQFQGVASTTDWTKLRIDPLLEHVNSLERLLRSPSFARETARLRRAVALTRSQITNPRRLTSRLRLGVTLRQAAMNSLGASVCLGEL